MNANNKTVILIISFLTGALFFCTYQEWLIIYWNKPYKDHATSSPVTLKKIVLIREKQDTWVQETTEVLWSENPQENSKTVTAAWLLLLEDQQLLSKKITIESVLFSPSLYEAYISFDQSPFDTSWSIHQKESFLKALLKTYKENGFPASSVYFLVNHKPLQDPHLDFTEPWIFSNTL